MSKRDRLIKRKQTKRTKEPRVYCAANGCTEFLLMSRIDINKQGGFQRDWWLSRNFSTNWCPEHVRSVLKR